MRLVKTILLATTFLASSGFAAHTEVNVVASIKPVHSLVAVIMDGVGTPGLIMEGAGSPHTYSMKPSQARMLESADVVFWVSRELETFLKKPLETVAAKAKAVELMGAHDLVKLKFRGGGAFESHDDTEREVHAREGDDHKHAKADHHGHGHADEKAEAKHDHKHGEKAEKDHDHGHKDDHGHDGINPHVWLDPMNAKALVHEIEETLVEADPANAAKYEANAKALMSRLDALVTEISTELETVRGKGFIVFHDAYPYFEIRFGLEASGAITISPDVMPGAERVAEIRDRIRELGAACVFAEPQFEPKLVSTVLEGSEAKSGVLDPLGAFLEDGPDLYFDLIRTMAKSFKSCLGDLS